MNNPFPGMSIIREKQVEFHQWQYRCNHESMHSKKFEKYTQHFNHKGALNLDYSTQKSTKQFEYLTIGVVLLRQSTESNDQ
jgi:hypothetical protein